VRYTERYSIYSEYDVVYQEHVGKNKQPLSLAVPADGFPSSRLLKRIRCASRGGIFEMWVDEWEVMESQTGVEKRRTPVLACTPKDRDHVLWPVLV
jgi:hypothetical protein